MYCNESYANVVPLSQNALLHCMYSVDTLDKGVTHTPCGMRQDSTRFHHATQNGARLKTSESLLEFSM